MRQRESLKGNIKSVELNEGKNTTYQNTWDTAKAAVKGRFIVLNTSHQKRGKASKNNILPQKKKKVKVSPKQVKGIK